MNYSKNYTMYYIRFDNKIISEYELSSAFALITKKSKWEDEGAYIRFLSDLIKNGNIIRWFRSDKVDDNYILSIAKDNKILGIKMYRDAHNTDIYTAKEAVENMLKKS